MKSHLSISAILISGIILAACGKEQPAPTPQVKKSVAKPAKKAPDLKSATQSAPPPPPAPSAATASATVKAVAPEEEKLDSEKVVLNAVQSFMISKERPPKDIQELVQAGFLKSMPVAPPGKKIVFDPVKLTVRLENQ